MIQSFVKCLLWFDVGIKRYTTSRPVEPLIVALWFDVGIKRYTTIIRNTCIEYKLWFDVGIKRYTTLFDFFQLNYSCGLM